MRKQLFREPRYTGGEHAAVYGWCHTVLRSALVVGRSVIFDATNLEERVRRRVYDIADNCEARLAILWVTCPPSVVQERMLRRQQRADEDDVSDADWFVYLQMRRRAEPIRRPHTVINTGAGYESLLRTSLLGCATAPEANAQAAGPAAEQQVQAQDSHQQEERREEHEADERGHDARQEEPASELEPVADAHGGN